MSTKHKHGVTAQQLAQRNHNHNHNQQPFHQAKVVNSMGQAATLGQAAKARQRNRYKSSRLHIPWLPLIVLVIGGLTIAVLIQRGVFQASPQGTLRAANTSYNFGTVPMKGGNITTQFPLTVQGDARAIDITST